MRWEVCLEGCEECEMGGVTGKEYIKWEGVGGRWYVDGWKGGGPGCEMGGVADQ